MEKLWKLVLIRCHLESSEPSPWRRAGSAGCYVAGSRWEEPGPVGSVWVVAVVTVLRSGFRRRENSGEGKHPRGTGRKLCGSRRFCRFCLSGLNRLLDSALPSPTKPQPEVRISAQHPKHLQLRFGVSAAAPVLTVLRSLEETLWICRRRQEKPRSI